MPHPVANLANAAALLYHTLDGLNWAGFAVAGDVARKLVDVRD